MIYDTVNGYFKNVAFIYFKVVLQMEIFHSEETKKSTTFKFCDILTRKQFSADNFINSILNYTQVN